MYNKKILMITNDINYSGSAKMLAYIANGLCDMGNRVIVYTYAGGKPYYPLNCNIEYIPAIKARKSYLDKMVYFLDINKVIRKKRPDAVVTFSPNSSVFSILCTAFTRIPVIVCERCDPYTEKGFLLRFKRSIYNYAEGAVFQTEGAKKYYSKRLQKKSVVIGNPVTSCRIERTPANKRNNDISFVGRFFVKQKRQDIMLKAFQKITAENDLVRLVFYGGGPDLPHIRQMAEQMNVSHKVCFMGEVGNILEAIKDTAVFVLTSDYEGIPNALIEAMAVGLPVVVTDCSPGGARLLVEDMVNGLLVPAGDVDKIAQAVLFMLNNSDFADACGSKAQQITETYSSQKILQEWNEYIRKVMGK